MEIVEKDLPQLIVALDSLNDDANYVHILDAKENTNYYCPCCKGIVKPRAYKQDKDYQVQAHYYHETGGCNEETFIHYICKNWLFENGCKFIVNDVQYEVENIEIEKTLHTSFGDYRPDITVTTTSGKVFYFEIKTTNRKSELYAPKWDELGNDVVEVDTRYFINQKYKNNIPVFNLIYSDGECFIKSYSRNDYEDIIAKRKLEWKRQDKLNYKIQWERLDWFWKYLQDYKNNIGTEDDVLNAFKGLDLYDMGVCWDLVFNKSKCFKDFKDEIREIINNKVSLEFEQYFLNIKAKYENILLFKCNSCIKKEGLYLSWEVINNTELTLFRYPISDRIFISDKHWVIHPNNFYLLKDDFDKVEDKIFDHLKNMKLIEEYIKSDISFYNFAKFMQNEQGYVFEKSCCGYINNIDNTIDNIKKQFQNMACDYFIKNISHLNKEEVFDIFKDYFNDFLLCKIHPNYLGYYDNYFYVECKGIKILEVEFCENNILKIDDLDVDYNIYSFENFKKYMINFLDNKITKMDLLLSDNDFIIELIECSNNIWKFRYNENDNTIVITMSYTIPYLNNYTKRIEVSNNVDIPTNIFENVDIFNYKSIATSVLNKYIAPIMQQMLDEEIEKYNMTHLTSIAYKYSEVKNGK